jgi:hypothetical protein
MSRRHASSCLASPATSSTSSRNWGGADTPQRQGARGTKQCRGSLGGAAAAQRGLERALMHAVTYRCQPGSYRTVTVSGGAVANSIKMKMRVRFAHPSARTLLSGRCWGILAQDARR